MRFNELRDENGNTLQSIAELLQEKAKKLGFTCVMVFASKEMGQIHTITNIGAPLPLVFKRLAQEMSAEPAEKNTLEVVTPPTPTVH